MKNNTENCKVYRHKLQELYDQDLSLSAELAEHIKSCTECLSFWNHLSTFATNTTKLIDREINKLPPVDFDNLFKKAEQKKKAQNRENRVRWISAVVLIGIGSVLGLRLYSRGVTKAMVSESADYVVENLFSSNFMEGVEWKAAELESGFSGWLSDIASGKEYF